VAPKTRRVVLRVMREQGFATNRTARGLAGGRTGLIGFTIPLLNESYFTGILAGAADALDGADRRLVICPTHHEHAREVSLLERLMGGTTDGAILVLPEESSNELRRLQEQGYPFVVADPRLPLDDAIPTVSVAHAAGARGAVDHLVALGHRRIALVTGTRGWVATEERVLGYRLAHAAAGLELDATLIDGGDYELDTGHAVAERLLAHPKRPTAFFACNDNLAAGALRATLERGLRVPEDVSIVGFDDTGVARAVHPQLTTVRQPLAELGRFSVALLNRLLEGQRTDTVPVELSTRLVLRASTAPLGGSSGSAYVAC
jgi:LacI family transcriptional regulator